jgi:hypothetical protein
MNRSKNGTLGRTTATLYIIYKIMFLSSGGGDTCCSSDIQQNTSHVRQRHIFHIEQWCSYDIRHIAFAFPV